MREGPLGLLASCPNAPKWSIPSSCRGSLTAGNDAPGPGRYDVSLAMEALQSQRFKESSFPKAEKDSKPPCCGSELGSISKMPPRIKGGVLREANNEPSDQTMTPGPEYCPPSTLKRQGAVYIGDIPMGPKFRPSSAPAAGRRDDTSASRSSSTSKGDPASKVPSQCPGFSFGRSQRDVPERHSPDTMYMPPSTLKKRSASCLNGHRPGEDVCEIRPDPQTYATEHCNEPSKQSFTAARRWKSQPQISHLGPGTYRTDIPAPVKGVVRMGSTQRFVEQEGEDQPGPGAYHPEGASTRGGGNTTTFARAPRHEAPKEFSHLGGERRAKVMRSFFRAGTLPPGTLRQRAARLPPRCLPRKVKGEKQPGPGSFETAVKHGPKNACIFSTSPRWHDKDQDPGPGPGSYRVNLESRSKLGKLAPKDSNGNPDESKNSEHNGPGPYYKVYTLFPLS